MKIYNTLTRKKEKFIPIEDKTVKMYVCGPTVYNFAHIGNLRTYINEDILRRYLEYSGYEIKEVMNITDVEDKIIRDMKANGLNPADINGLKKYTEKYTALFIADMERLNIEQPTEMPRATNKIQEMIGLIEELLKKGFAYKSADGSIYFSIAKFKDYGKLTHLDLSGLKEGARVDQDEYEKENAQDFVLWKAKTEGEPSWTSPFGEGRPGWHIECSAMSMEALGETIDIHAGAVDLMFPHHENEIAQSEASTGKQFVNYWFHPEHLMINGEKMSKSLKNIYTLDDINAKFGLEPLEFRMLCLGSHYRERLNFTPDSAIQAKQNLKKLYNFVQLVDEKETSSMNEDKIEAMIKSSKQAFESALNDDLNMPMALAAVFNLVKQINMALEAPISETEKSNLLYFIAKVDGVLGLNLNFEVNIPNEITTLIKERDVARTTKDWERADKLRMEIGKEGYEILDTSNGSRVRKLL